MLIAIDHGNYAIKTPDDSFVAGLSSSKVEPSLSDEVIEYSGQFHTLTGNRIPYMRDKTQDERYFILSLFAISRQLSNHGNYFNVSDGSMKINLAVGLPPEHYSRQKLGFANYFRRSDISFSYNDRPMLISIDQVLVYPQCFAALAGHPWMKDESDFFVVDVGGYTIDVLLVKKGRPDMTYCRSLELGMIPMCNKIINEINSAYGISLNEWHIENILNGKNSILRQEIRSNILKQVSLYCDSIINQLREIKVELQATPAIFLGGGSLWMKECILDNPLVAKAAFINNIHANAIGYKLIGDGQLAKK